MALSDTASRDAKTASSHTDGAASAMPMKAAQDVDFSFYTWTTLFKSFIGTITPEERRAYLLAKDIKNEEKDCKRCEDQRDWLLQRSPVIRFMREQIQGLGADLNGENMRCRRCTTAQLGGFDSNYGILLCANELATRDKVEETMAHEMVHAYDHLRWKVDPDNMKHQACTEVGKTAVPVWYTHTC
jgi:inner membrane protease ATP23